MTPGDNQHTKHIDAAGGSVCEPVNEDMLSGGNLPSALTKQIKGAGQKHVSN